MLPRRGSRNTCAKGVALDLNQVVSVDITLQLGSSAESVEVTGAPPVVDTSSTQLGAVVNERSSTQLPLNQRDVYQLLQLQPGVQSQLGNDLFYGSDRAGVVTVNGGRGRSNNYTVNGGDGNDLFANLPAVEPSPDSIEEFRVISNSFDAEYGRNSGAVVNVVTKSGTNDLHGSFYEFFRNDVLNAHPFTFVQSSKPAFKQNQFGGTIGGPIKKDKTFFFASYEGTTNRAGYCLSTSNRADGDGLGGRLFWRLAFYGLADRSHGRQCPAKPLRKRQRDPRIECGATGPVEQRHCGNSGTLQRPDKSTQFSLFPNNQIPTQCFDPVATEPAAVRARRGWKRQPSHYRSDKRDRGDQFQIKIDHSFNNNQKTGDLLLLR